MVFARRGQAIPVKEDEELLMANGQSESASSSASGMQLIYFAADEMIVGIDLRAAAVEHRSVTIRIADMEARRGRGPRR